MHSFGSANKAAGFVCAPYFPSAAKDSSWKPGRKLTLSRFSLVEMKRALFWERFGSSEQRLNGARFRLFCSSTLKLSHTSSNQ